MNNSIFNDVLGPVMRGPSSSHTAASYRIAAIGRSLLKSELCQVRFLFDRSGSYGEVFRQQGSDLAFAAGASGWEITDPRFENVLEIACREGLKIDFEVGKIPGSDHPNEVLVFLTGENGDSVEIIARSVGGGAIEVTEVDGWPVSITGACHDLFVVAELRDREIIAAELKKNLPEADGITVQQKGDLFHIHIPCMHRPPESFLEKLQDMSGVSSIRITSPVMFVCSGKPLFTSARELLELAEKRGTGLAELALSYESEMLGLSEEEVWKEMSRRLDIMEEAVRSGIEEAPDRMKLIRPSAGSIFQAEKKGTLPVGGLHSRAMARALGVMHVNGSKGIVCAAPTAGSAGVIPGVLVTLAEEKELSREEKIRGLFTASAIGLIVSIRATFAAEVAGCQAEIGVAGAMASAAVVELAGGNPKQALDAAGVFLQNSLGSICDPVQGFVEIPCHTRNGAAASSAFVCADMVVGGYINPIPFDETVDAMYSVGKMLPREFRCTALGGLSACPSACTLSNLNS